MPDEIRHMLRACALRVEVQGEDEFVLVDCDLDPSDRQATRRGSRPFKYPTTNIARILLRTSTRNTLTRRSLEHVATCLPK